MRKRNAVIALFVAFYLGIWLQAGDSDPDFSGKWLLDAASSDTRALGPVEASLTVVQTDAAVSCMAGQLRWSYPLDGSSTRSRFGEEFRSSASKWEGSALLVNTLVSGAQNYTVMERWTLSRDLNTLTIRRQVMRQGSEIEGRSLYRREGASAPNLTSQNGQSEAPMSNRQPTLARRPEPAVEPEIMVRTGTRILLSLINVRRRATGYICERRLLWP